MKGCLVTDLEVTLLEEVFHCVNRMMPRCTSRNANWENRVSSY